MKFIECKIVGRFKRYIDHDGKRYNMRGGEEFFAEYKNQDTVKLNVGRVISAEVQPIRPARLAEVKDKRSALFRAFRNLPRFRKELVLIDAIDVCRLIIDTGRGCEVLYVNKEAYDLLNTENENK